MYPGLNFLETGGWCLYVPLWTKFRVGYDMYWMEKRAGYWRLNWFCRYRSGTLRAELYWTPPLTT